MQSHGGVHGAGKLRQTDKRILPGASRNSAMAGGLTTRPLWLLDVLRWETPCAYLTKQKLLEAAGSCRPFKEIARAVTNSKRHIHRSLYGYSVQYSLGPSRDVISSDGSTFARLQYRRMKS